MNYFEQWVTDINNFSKSVPDQKYFLDYKACNKTFASYVLKVMELRLLDYKEIRESYDKCNIPKVHLGLYFLHYLRLRTIEKLAILIVAKTLLYDLKVLQKYFKSDLTGNML